MSRKQMLAITSDVTGEVFYASDDGKTTDPFTYVNADGETVGADVMPNEKRAIFAMLTGDTEEMYQILRTLAPKVTRGSVDDAKRKDVLAFIVTRDSLTEAPKRLTRQMVEAYDAHIAAVEAKKLADAANAEQNTPQSRQERRAAKAAADAANADSEDNSNATGENAESDANA